MRRQPRSFVPGPWILLLGLIVVLGCSKNPTGPDPTGQAAQMLSSGGVEVFSTVSSIKQISDLLDGPTSNMDVGIPEVENPQQAVGYAKRLLHESFMRAEVDHKVLAKGQGTLSESVIWDVTFRDTVRGFSVRNSLLYDSETGHGRLFHVRFNFDDRHLLAYDSTEIKVDLNSTIFEGADDVLLSLEILKKYKPGKLVQEEWVSLVPDPYSPGTEPTGGVLESIITHSATSFVTATHSRLEYHEASGGSWSKEVEYSDGTHSSEQVTFAEGGTGTFEETRRDGTHIVGTFDSAEEDGQGSFTKTITFPEGHDPVSIYEAGEFTQNLADSTLHGSFEKEVRFKDGATRRESVAVDESRSNGVKTTTVSVGKPNGSGGTITIVETVDGDQVSGEWTNRDKTFLVFSGETYPDGSAHYEFELYASKEAYANGEAPIASGEFNFFPDGSGQGSVAEDGGSQNVTIHSDGTADVG